MDGGGDDGERADARRLLDVVDLMMRTAEVHLSAGVSAHDVVDTMLRISDAYDVPHVHVDLTYNSVHVTHFRDGDQLPVTALRVMDSGQADFRRLREVHRLVMQIEREALPLRDAHRRIVAIQEAPATYPAWVVTAGSALIGVGVVMSASAEWRLMLLTFVAGCLMNGLLGLLIRVGVPSFFRQVAGGLFMVLFAGGATALDRRGVGFFTDMDPNLIVVGGIIALLAGGTVVSAVQDGLDHFNVTASARLFEAVLRTTGIVVGIVAGLDVVARFGDPLRLSTSALTPAPVPLQFLGAAVVAAGLVVTSFGDRLTLALAMLMGLVAWTCYFMLAVVGAAEAASNSVGAFAAALVSTLAVRRSSVPGFALATAAILPLLPGLDLYDGLLQVVVKDADGAALLQGIRRLLVAGSVALGIAAGATLGTFMARPVADRLGRQGDRAAVTGEPT